MLLAVLATIWFWRIHHWAPRATGPLAHQVYVWQRTWDGPVQAALNQHATNFERVVVLAGEVTWDRRTPRLVRVDLDYPALQRSGAPIGLALRIGAFRGPFTRNDAVARWLSSTAGALLQAAKTNGVGVAEFQIDFDCATAQLKGYQRWLEALRPQVAPVPLTLTALPAWLDRRDFAALVRASDGYVLQVHSLEPPRAADDGASLCDPEKARRWVERAARLGVPFRVALPTYGYRLAFDADQRLLGINAEGPEKIFPGTAFQRELRSDPAAMAAVVQAWGNDRPSSMVGVIWYRLPVMGDRLNWSWPTMSEVIAGRIPQPQLQVRLRSAGPGLREMALVNVGAADFVGTPNVRASWNAHRLVAADALAGFDLAGQTATNVTFSIAQAVRFAPGEQRWIGWLRLDQESEVAVELLR